MKDYFVEQADYQHWASSELFKSLDDLSDEQRKANLGLFFHDIHKTVDHILVVTRNWRARFAGEFDKVNSYDVLLYPDWADLKSAVLNEFSQLKGWLAQKNPGWLQEVMEYPAADGGQRRVSVTDGLIHVMTHAVHHRGQISAVCTRLHAPSPKMDFVFYRARRVP
ncbi:MAG: DinB family protein [Sulfuricaulis sp.]